MCFDTTALHPADDRRHWPSHLLFGSANHHADSLYAYDQVQSSTFARAAAPMFSPICGRIKIMAGCDRAVCVIAPLNRGITTRQAVVKMNFSVYGNLVLFPKWTP